MLLSRDGAGHQLKINTAEPGDTASLLFQTGFSRRAEMGTAGDDDFHLKVSGNGSAWNEALVIDRGMGAVSFPNTAPRWRERLAADRTYYVRTDGDDGNDGLADSAGGAFRTVQHVIDIAYGTIDIGPHHVTIRLGNETYAGSVDILAPHVGSGTITLAGNAASPGSTVIQRTAPSLFALAVRNYATLIVRDLEFNSASNILLATGGGRILGLSNIRLSGNSGVGNAQLLFQVGGVIEPLASGAAYVMAGNAGYHARATAMGQINLYSTIVDVTGRAFSGAFAAATRLSELSFVNASFIGTAAGKRYEASLNGLVHTNSGNTTFLPGDTAGTTTTGGLYT